MSARDQGYPFDIGERVQIGDWTTRVRDIYEFPGSRFVIETAFRVGSHGYQMVPAEAAARLSTVARPRTEDPEDE